MDTVIFTEGMPLEEFKRDRPREYQELVESGKLEEALMPAPAERDIRFWKRVGFLGRRRLVRLVQGAQGRPRYFRRLKFRRSNRRLLRTLRKWTRSS